MDATCLEGRKATNFSGVHQKRTHEKRFDRRVTHYLLTLIARLQVVQSFDPRQRAIIQHARQRVHPSLRASLSLSPARASARIRRCVRAHANAQAD
eukprot:1170145-Pleurochrysis_carterae.AAC.4